MENKSKNNYQQEALVNEDAIDMNFNPAIIFSKDLADCLSSHHHNKYSRAEAFVDIMQILHNNFSVFMQQRKRAIAAGCEPTIGVDKATEFSFITTNCSALAKRWHWNRITVRNFLTELENTKILVCIKEGHSVTIYMERNA